MGGLLGALLLGVNRFETSLSGSSCPQAASIKYHFDFTRCSRSFIAVQGAYVLVTFVTGAMYAASAVWGESLGPAFFGSSAGSGYRP